MMVSLAPEARAGGYRLETYDSLPSTMSEATARARAGDLGPLWIVAAEQTAGRGRRGSTWSTPRGNLAASLVYPLGATAPEQVATLGFVAGVALSEALDDVGAGAVAADPDPAAGEGGRIALKWPNDVLAGGAKLSGILLETEAFPAGRAVVIGIGVNVATAPEGLPYAATSLRALGYRAEVADLFAALSRRFAAAATAWAADGFAAIRGRWLARASGLDGPVAVRLGGEVVQGIFETIDEAGRLVVRAADGSRRTVSAGEVHFGVAASAHAA
jgi:BirA family transcriptional regulator, biotin operon repressor / biotin---[acetyl-CoA-carboxylase] ligase